MQIGCTPIRTSRLVAGENDLAPLTTLLDAAKEMGRDIDDHADAQREVRDWLGREPTALERHRAHASVALACAEGRS